MAEEINVGMKCIKYMLFVTNFMFVMIGFLLISIGSTIKAIYTDFDVFMADHYYSPATLLVAIGIIIFFVALFGCLGAVRESVLLINIFGGLLLIITVLELSAAIAAYSMRGQIRDTINIKMRESISHSSNEFERDTWDFTQSRLQCCGVVNRDDWYHPQQGLSETVRKILSLQEDNVETPKEDSSSETTSDDSSTPKSDDIVTEPAKVPTSTAKDTVTQSSVAANISVTETEPAKKPTTTGNGRVTESSVPVTIPDLWKGPASCCPNYADQCSYQQTYEDGCLDALTYIVSESALLLGCGALAVAFIQLLGVVFAQMLAKAVRKLKTEKLVERELNRQKVYEQMFDVEDSPIPVMYTPSWSEA